MRTNIHIDDNLISDAQRLSGAKTKREAVEQGLKLLVQMHEQQSIRQLRGKLQWDSDLDQMRQGINTTESSL
ncbi:type II toxin-antitoxin system VapB family antitoxin [Psychrobacter sp. M13]|uniref:type II toxin-antitoxin system VapB family antitoxin n=1 Tax=Psychrobacter sp. M13 TaxID=3067275 RepID=UPI00273C3A90|nr:type II toxin-antitoxin system VapB family antitoxin [Psychrobacter sp. M13]WLP94323.1 type II toxin-antitoxin system VapB family antitoxin [Psychrobacter sp. M13]